MTWKKVAKIIKSEYFWFLFILAIGIFLRLYKLVDVPPGFTGDEAWLGLDGQEVAKRGWIGIYIPNHAWGYNALHAYLSGLTIKILGPSVVSTRLAASIPGILNLVSFYFLSRLFFSSKISLILLSLLSVSRWHIHFSRLALPGIILIPLFSSLSLLFLIMAMKKNNLLFFLVTGLFIGLGLNSYFFFASAFITISILIFIGLIIRRANFKNIIFLALVVLITTAPFGIYVLKNPSAVNGKWQFRSIFNLQNKKILLASEGLTQASNFKTIMIQIKKTGEGLFLKGDTDGINNLPGTPALETIVAIFFVGGFLMTVSKIKEEKNYFFCFWLLLSLTPGILTEGAPNFKRTIDTILPIFLIIGNLLQYLENKVNKKIFLAIAAGLSCYSLIINYRIYFIKYADNPDIKSRYAYEIVKMCDFFNRENNSTYIYFYHPNTYFNYETRRFLCPNLIGEDRSKEYGQFSIESSKKPSFTFVYFGTYRKIVADLVRKYPQGQNQEFNEDNNFVWGLYSVEEK